MTIKPLLLALPLFYMPAAYADFYLGGQLNYGSVKTSAEQDDGTGTGTVVTHDFDGSVASALGQLGFFFNDFSAVEMRMGSGVSKSNGIEVDSLIGGYGKFNFPITKQVAFYGLAGYSKVKLDIGNKPTESGFSAGLGFHYAFDRYWAMTGEYMSYVRSSSATVDGFALGLQYKF